MTIATYDELVSEVEAWLNRTDLTARIPTFIRLFEARFNRLVRAPAMETSATSETAASEDGVALPSGFLQMRSAYLATDPIAVLEYMTPGKLRDTYAANTTGQPIVFTIEGQSLVLAPVPDGVYTLTLAYFERLTGLDATNDTNWLLDDYPDAYLYGVLAEAYAFERDDEASSRYQAAWQGVMAEITREARSARVGGPMRLRATVSE
jgi:hypothetical protein